MVIISQNGKHTTESLELSIECIEKTIGGDFPDFDIEIIGYCIVESIRELRLGTYKTEERAKEVLEEIVKICKDEEIFYIRKSSLNNLDELEEPKYILKPVSKLKVYEMPKE